MPQSPRCVKALPTVKGSFHAFSFISTTYPSFLPPYIGNFFFEENQRIKENLESIISRQTAWIILDNFFSDILSTIFLNDFVWINFIWIMDNFFFKI